MFTQIWNALRREILLGRMLNEEHPRSETDLDEKIERIVDSKLQRLREDFEFSDSMENVDAKRLVDEHRNRLDELVNDKIAGLKINDSARESLYSLLQFSVKSSEYSGNHTGIVIAGFGDEEIFPVLYEVTVDGILSQMLKYDLKEVCEIGQDSVEAAIIPFAQVDMVSRFMEGVDPMFLAYLVFTTKSLLQKFGESILSEHALEDDQYLEKVGSLSNQMMRDYFESLKEFRCKEFTSPITKMIQFLPKEELGGMAEAMVSLTSLKRRVSLELETVGGPVDVAIISKGDGFIWQKRKHYFNASLNPDYFNRLN